MHLLHHTSGPPITVWDWCTPPSNYSLLMKQKCSGLAVSYDGQQLRYSINRILESNLHQVAGHLADFEELSSYLQASGSRLDQQGPADKRHVNSVSTRSRGLGGCTD